MYGEISISLLNKINMFYLVLFESFQRGNLTFGNGIPLLRFIPHNFYLQSRATILL